MLTSTVTRHGEPTSQYTVTSSDTLGIYMDLVRQLSSPISSYVVDDEADGPGLVIKHQDSYSVRLQSAKDTIEQLKNDVEFLREEAMQRREEAMQRKKIIIDWEIRSRIAQALNDNYVDLLPQPQYLRLKAAVPYLLTAWAVDQGRTTVQNQIEEDQYRRKIGSLRARHLVDDIEPIWDTIPANGRKLMITSWINRDTPGRSNIAHPTPTVAQALSLIQLDHDVTSEEFMLAEEVILGAADKQGKPFFSS
ncbi:hypothetical protein M378DRAFT_6236 [Amanita muscaria Koide BX008]|uniref:Uncharacterized protein n=1 Tax=Amanita muscaria (strain Koide BX008) TaxID=946122 RepID=A0A0C2XAU8_AMAMK|nr:hypothetical protein M378DRAFT_6236 [Amanita muscaria Koide BX008]